MTRSELIARIAEQYPHLMQRDAVGVVSTVFNEIADALAKGRRVELRGFGAFSVKRRQAREGRNPRTGEPVSVAPKYSLHFKTGRDMHNRLNDGGPTEGP